MPSQPKGLVVTQVEFKKKLAEFTSKGEDEFAMSDDLLDIDLDSLGIYEFLMEIEDTVGQDVDVSESVTTVQDLYDLVLTSSGTSSGA